MDTLIGDEAVLWLSLDLGDDLDLAFNLGGRSHTVRAGFRVLGVTHKLHLEAVGGLVRGEDDVLEENQIHH